QARNLPLAPAAPVLQVVAGLDGEVLKALISATPTQAHAHQRCIDGTGVEQPATQLTLSERWFLATQFDQGAVAAALHAQARHIALLRIGVQREPAHAVLLLLITRFA